MKNIGPKSREWLASVGVYTLDDVAKLGVVETYKRVKAAYPKKYRLIYFGDCKQHCWTYPGTSCRQISSLS